MKILIIGGNRFVGLRLSLALDARANIDLHVLNRSGQVAHSKRATIHIGNRSALENTFLDRDWDVVVDFACFTANEARESLSFFKSVKRYIFISTASVYDPGPSLSESSFDAANWRIKDQPSPEERMNSYQFGKRQAEAVFMQEAPFPVASIRFPFILGPDDYTRRLDFHIERVMKNEPIFLPNSKARISTTFSEDAAKFLVWSLDKNFSGPINFASPEAISLDELIAMIEASTGCAAKISNDEKVGEPSPYGVSSDIALNIGKVQGLGFTPMSIKRWLPKLIAEFGTKEPTKIH